jgi:hypothetical protein
MGDIRKITLEIIPHDQQRYPTCGDYFKDENGDWKIVVSDMKDIRMCYLVWIHELAEVLLTEYRGITEKSISDFDIEYENTHDDDSEPGDDQKAPYVQEHCIATAIERLMCAELGVAWRDYDKAVLDLFNENGKEYTHAEFLADQARIHKENHVKSSFDIEGLIEVC